MNNINLSIDKIEQDPNYNVKNLFTDPEQTESNIYDTHNCQYYSLDEFSNEFGKKHDQFSIFSINVRSLLNKTY